MDLQSLQPVLEKAFEAASIKLRQPDQQQKVEQQPRQEQAEQRQERAQQQQTGQQPMQQPATS